MKPLRPVEPSRNPMVLEREMLNKLRLIHASDDCSLQVRFLGQRLVLDGYVGDVATKFRIEETCREAAPQITILNRLRVGLSGDSAVS